MSERALRFLSVATVVAIVSTFGFARPNDSAAARGAEPRSSKAAKSRRTPSASDRRAPVLGPLPATFIGILACADCAGIQYQINLLEGGAFMQRTTYMRDGRDESLYEVGTWVLSTDGRSLVLDGGREASAYWGLKDSKTLRKLNAEGHEIVSTLPYDLTRAATFRPLEPRVRLRGLFRYMADAARFSDCLSGLQWPVAHQGAYADLERAYNRQKEGPGTDLMVTLDGRVALLPAMGGDREEATLVVERFVRASPGEICMEKPSQMDLANTRWRPTVIDGDPVVVSANQREPWIVLDPRTLRFTGSGGCNRISGSYRAASDDRLSFTNVVSTRMACASMDIERRFLAALDRTRRFHIVGRHLELLGADGSVLARLEERNLD